MIQKLNWSDIVVLSAASSTTSAVNAALDAVLDITPAQASVEPPH